MVEAIIVLSIVLGLITLCVISAWAELFLARKSAGAGLIIPFILLFIEYLVPILLLVCGMGILYALCAFALLDLPLLLCLWIYLYIRMKRHKKLQDEYVRQNHLSPGTGTLPKALRKRISEFYDSSINLSREAQQNIVASVKSKISVRRVATFIGCQEEDVTDVMASFEKFDASMTARESGENYEFSPSQKDLFLQLIISSTPGSLDCGEERLWSRHSLRELFSSFLNRNISLYSVDEFLRSYGLIIPNELLSGGKKADPALKNWIDEVFDKKIRLRSLEEETDIAFLYTVSAKPDKKKKKMTMLASVSKEGIVSFGVYKGDGGYRDFADKLIQDHNNKLLAVTYDEDTYNKYAQFSCFRGLYLVGKDMEES